mmetsp:Transcript_13396/g.11435  ORF Transcript_13396/g.11435 Transcript_13396/m.11435 type:complete len:114 (-) Transcript_13396:216-557(-)
MMNPEAAAALDAAVDGGIDSSLDPSQIYLGGSPPHNRDRAMTTVDGMTSNPAAVCRKASASDAMVAMEFENKEDVLDKDIILSCSSSTSLPQKSYKWEPLPTDSLPTVGSNGV